MRKQILQPFSAGDPDGVMETISLFRKVLVERVPLDNDVIAEGLA